MRIASSNFLSVMREQTNKCCGGCTVHLGSAGGWKQIHESLKSNFQATKESEDYFIKARNKSFSNFGRFNYIVMIYFSKY